jgi:BlaI family transcriptional regulator, penicillinase repressor
MELSPQDVTDAELAVLQQLWDRGAATIRQLTEAIYPEGTPSLYGTVQKLLERLEAKGCVTRDRDTWPHVFRAIISRDELIGLRLRVMAEKLCGGSLTPLLTHLVEGERLTAQQRQALRARLDELEDQSPSRDRRR